MDDIQKTELKKKLRLMAAEGIKVIALCILMVAMLVLPEYHLSWHFRIAAFLSYIIVLYYTMIADGIAEKEKRAFLSLDKPQ